MKFLRKMGMFFLILIAGLVALIAFRYPYLFKGIRTIYLKGHTTSYISDFRQYPYRKIEKGNTREWPLHPQYNRLKTSAKLEKYNRRYGTVAYLVIKDDSLLLEKYYKGYTQDSLSNSFSMAKSLTMLLLAKAIDEGAVKGLDQKLRDFVPEIQGPYADSVTLGDLAAMSGGTDWDENYYSPFSITAESYFSDDLDDLMTRKVRFIRPPGRKWFYSSGDSQFLGMVIRRATGKTLARYLSENFWKPMGMRREAYWNTDRPGGMEKAFCCVNANARDFSRFGKLMLHHGNWEGRQLVDSALVDLMTRPHFADMPSYGLQWWIFDRKGVKGYCMRGHLGQYVIVVPSRNLIVTRLGERKPHSRPGTFARDFYVYLDEGLRLARLAEK